MSTTTFRAGQLVEINIGSGAYDATARGGDLAAGLTIERGPNSTEPCRALTLRDGRATSFDIPVPPSVTSVTLQDSYCVPIQPHERSAYPAGQKGLTVDRGSVTLHPTCTGVLRFGATFDGTIDLVRRPS